MTRGEGGWREMDGGGVGVFGGELKRERGRGRRVDEDGAKELWGRGESARETRG